MRRSNLAPGASVQGQPAEESWDTLLFAVAVTHLTFIWRFQDIIPVVADLQVTKIAPLTAVGLLLVGKRGKGKWRVLRHPITKLALVIFALMVALIPFSQLEYNAFGFTFGDHLKTLLMALITAMAVRNVGDIERLMAVQIFGAAVFFVVAKLTIARGGYGLGDSLAYYDANDFSMMVVITLPLSLYFVRFARRKSRRIVSFAASLVLLYAIVASGSRGAFLALLCVVVYYLYSFRTVSPWVRFGVVASLALGFLVFASGPYLDRLQTLTNPTQGYNWNAEAGRIAIWKRGLGYMWSNPWGLGPAMFEIAEGTMAPQADRQLLGRGWSWNSPHNSFIEVGAELGFVGLSVFVAMIGLSLKRLWTTTRRKIYDRTTRGLAQAFVGTLVAYCVAAFFLSQGYAAYLYACLGLITGFLIVRSPRPGIQHSWRGRMPWKRYSVGSGQSARG